MQYANDMMGRAHSSVKCPAVIGAIIDLGYCMDLTDSLYLGELKESYNVLVETCTLSGNWVGHRECHILPDWLLIYRYDDDVIVLTLTRTGSHSDLFNL